MRPVTRALARAARPGADAHDRLRRATSGTEPLTVLGWHRLGPRGGDGLTTGFDDFRRHLDVIEESGARVLPLERATRLLRAGTLPPGSVALTFDDGYASVVEQAWPELERRGMAATLFAVSGFLDSRRRFPWDRGETDTELIRLVDRAGLVDAAAAGLDIGSHTVTHRWLRHLDPRAVGEELAASRTELELLLGRPVRTFAYPMGGWTPAIREQAVAAGYEVAITVDRGRNRSGQHPLSLRRSFASDRPEDVRLQLAGAMDWARPVDTFRARRGPRPEITSDPV